MTDANVAGFEPLYDEAEHTGGRIPWDIGGPQPVVQQLVAYGGIRGEVLDPGTGPGYHAIHFAAQGYSATGIDDSPSAIERAKRNAERAGVQVDFQVADATKLDGFEGRFDTVVDSAFYHVFLNDEATQTRYAQALHRATKPGRVCTCSSSAPTTSTACSGRPYPPTTSSGCSVPADGASTTWAARPTRPASSRRRSTP
ncbi:MAG: class I SAM-dependent methyltransferase [Mycobacterium sp.]